MRLALNDRASGVSQSEYTNAIKYIESSLDGEISYDEAARIACCSTYYFQRIFTYVTGITLADYIRRRRMSQAAFESIGVGGY